MVAYMSLVTAFLSTSLAGQAVEDSKRLLPEISHSLDFAEKVFGTGHNPYAYICYKEYENFKYDQWIGYEINIPGPEDIAEFKIRERDNLTSNNLRYWSEDKAHSAALGKDRISKMLKVVGPCWKQMKQIEKITVNEFVKGFSERYTENMRHEKFVEYTDLRSSDDPIAGYINEEIKAGRMLYLGNGLQAIPFDYFISCKVIALKEKKFEASGTEYFKWRFVYNAVKANEFVRCPAQLIGRSTASQPQPIFEPMEFTTPDIEVIFRHEKLYSKLILSRYLSVLDKKNYYRQFHLHPSSWPTSIIVTKNKMTGETKNFLDLLVGWGQKSRQSGRK